MQVKKEDLRQAIYDAACYEIMHKGYEVASLRSIVKKANTSLGNFYRYYPSKEALMDEIMQHAYVMIDDVMVHHFNERVEVNSAEELQAFLDEPECWESNFRSILNIEVAIYVKQELPKYQKQKAIFLSQMRQHLAFHLHCESESDFIVQIITNMFLDGFVFIVKSNLKKDQAMAEFIRLFRSICHVLIPNGKDKT